MESKSSSPLFMNKVTGGVFFSSKALVAFVVAILNAIGGSDEPCGIFVRILAASTGGASGERISIFPPLSDLLRRFELFSTLILSD